jgi:hypothetical protein
MCEQQYFIEYVLGWRGPSGQKADKGTIVHKILEILAVIKHGAQQKQKHIEDDILGKISVEKYDLENIIQEVYNYYIDKCDHHNWSEKDFYDCRKWTYKAIEYNNGMFDPRNREILCPEQRFDIPIEKDWAKYSYNINNENLSGTLALKGTVDLITKVDNNTLEIIDWKTGRRLDWATGQEKTQEKLENDPQLRIYHYAVQKLYPEYDHVIVTIFFINDGGPFSILFDKSDIIQTETMLRNKFEVIKKNRKPSLNKSWMCTKLCHFGKTTFDNTHVHPLQEYRDNQVCSKNNTMTKCEQIKHDIDLKGMDAVVDEYSAIGYNVGSYKAPGSVE